MIVFIRQIVHTALIVVAATACATSSERIDWHERDSYSGWVTDAATGEPLEGAVVVAVWQILKRHHIFIVEGNPSIEIIRLEETLTDKNGRFQFAPLGNYTPPLTWQRDEGAYPVLLFFKPGYEPTARQRFTWEFGEEARLAPNLRGVPLRKEGWQREIQLYRYLGRPLPVERTMNPIYQRLSDEQKIVEPLTNFASGLDRNVRLFGESKRRQREAIEAQWRAIVMVDEEIRRYRPNYEWLSTAIRDALSEKRKKEGLQ